jgi:hypothetical protein
LPRERAVAFPWGVSLTRSAEIATSGVESD